MITVKNESPMDFRRFLVYAIVLTFSLQIMSSCTPTQEKDVLVMYCAAGMKPPIEKLAREYEEKYGIRIEIQYGGSGTLLSGLRVTKTGDLYLAADESYMVEAEKQDLIAETQPLATLMPVIAVKKGNPKKLSGIQDLLKEDVSFALANPGAASIGKQTKIILEAHDLWEPVKAAVTVLKPTVNEVANDIHIGSVDAGIIWDATANQYDDLEIIPSEMLKKYKKKVTVGVLNSTEKPTEALKFLRFLSSKEFGNPTFQSMGFEAISGDHWDEKPTILLFSGGVNRMAVEATIQAFEAREGVNVERVYNGCGILVSQINSGQRPDAYLTCDISFMDQVQDKFMDITDISNTKILIAVKKDNPKGIKDLNDLIKSKMRIGVCNPEQSALGALTKRLLEPMGIWEKMQPNIYVQTPTADLLVNQLRTGSLDAVIVYEANISQVRDKLTIIPIDDPHAMAFQNYGIGQNSEYYWLLSRLLKAITSDASKQNFLSHGFSWDFKGNDDL